MLRSLMTAVTGVRAHQTMLDVVGNNVANANTAGFKKDMTVFQDLMYQSQKMASAPSDGRGGVNPAQVGLGVTVGAIETIHTQGAANYTGNPADMMIQGKGFFVLDNGTGDYLYTRAGTNTLDANHDLVQSGTGYKVKGYEMIEDPLNPGNYTKDSDL
ncbi:MAG: flagellar hook-basal body complex protein, partial [Synergistaceae bacterium]|nr:flagellar hook-basal body complex protein [Synergistaceae bacterium]